MGCMETKSSMHGFSRDITPQAGLSGFNVLASAAGAQYCAEQCKSRSFELFSLECPGEHGVHCQCGNPSTGLSAASLSNTYCEDGLGQIAPHAHCVGPYEMGGYRLGDYNVASVYRSGYVPPVTYNDPRADGKQLWDHGPTGDSFC